MIRAAPASQGRRSPARRQRPPPAVVPRSSRRGENPIEHDTQGGPNATLPRSNEPDRSTPFLSRLFSATNSASIQTAPQAGRKPASSLQPALSADPRLAKTQALLRGLAPVLGLSADRIEVRWDDAARETNESHHSRGLMARGRVLLHPAHYDPSIPEGRYLLAHEVAHLAQREERQLVPGAVRPDPAAAEREADAIGQAFARNQPFFPTRTVLPAGVVAARPTSSPAAPGQVSPDQLSEAVRDTYKSELSAIREYLATGFLDWAVRDWEIERILTILAGFSWVTARAIVSALSPGERWTLAQNVSPGHWKLFRLQILAAFAALAEKHRLKLSRSNFSGMSLHGFTDEEHFALRKVLGNDARLHREVASLAKSPQDREAWERLRSAEVVYDEEAELQKALETTLEVERIRKERGARVTKDDLAPRLKRWRKILDGWWITDAEALRVLDEIGAFLPEEGAVEAIGQALEQAGLLDDLITNVPADRIYEKPSAGAVGGQVPDRRKTLLRLASVRPAYQNLELAKKFLSYCWYCDWAITSDDAFMAFQLVKVLPAGSQAAFFSLSDGLYAYRLNAHMSQQMREGETMNFYTGGKDQRELKSIQVQILDDRLWMPDASRSNHRWGRLESLIRMAIAAGEHEWVFEQSKRRYPLLRAAGVYDDAEFRTRIIEKFRLYRSQAADDDGNIYLRERYEPESLKGVPFSDELLEAIGHIPVLGSAVNIVPFLAQVIDFLWHSDGGRIIGSLFTKSVGGRRLNLHEMQDLLDGSLLGARLKPARRRPKSRQHRNGESAGNADVNYASARWDFANGRLEAEVEELSIAAVSYPLEAMKFQTGEGTATGLRVLIGYPTRTNNQSPFLDLKLRSLRVSDVLISFPDLLQNINEVSVDDVAFRMGARSTNFDRLPKPSRGLDLGAFLLLPILGKFVSLPVISRGKQTLSESALTMPSALLEPRLPMDMAMSAGRTSLKGFSDSTGQFIASIELTDLTIRGGDSLETYRLALEESIRDYDLKLQNVARDLGHAAPDQLIIRSHRLREIRKSLLKELEATRAKESELITLRGKDEKKLTAAEKKRLRELRGGVLLDLGELHLEGLDGPVNLGQLRLTDLHGQGTSLVGALSLLNPNETIARLIKGETYRPTLLERDRETSSFKLDLGSFAMGPLALRDPVPTLREVDQQLEKLSERITNSPRDVSLVEQRLRLEERRKKVARYEELISRGLARLSRNEETEVVGLRQEIINGSGLEIARIAARDASVSLGPLGLKETADRSESDRVDRSRISGAGLVAEHLEVQGIRVPEQGLEVKTIQGESVSLQYDRDTDGGRLRVKGTSLSVEGVTRSTSRDLLTQERAALFEQVRLRAPVALFMPPDVIESLLKEAISLRRELGQAYARQHLARAEARLDTAADERVEELERQLEVWKKNAGYQELLASRARLGQLYARQHLDRLEGRQDTGLDSEIRELEPRITPILDWLAQLDPARLDLTHEIVGLQIALPARRRMAEIDGMLAELSSLQSQLQAKEEQLRAAREKALPVAKLEQEVAQILWDIDRWEKRIVLGSVVAEGIDLSVSGIGNIFADDYDFSSRLRGGLTIEGGRPEDKSGDLQSNPWARRIEVRDSRLPGLEATRVEVSQLRGKITSGAERIRFEEVGFDALTLESFSFRGTPHLVYSNGISTLSDLEVTGEIRMTTTVNEFGETEWSPSGLHLDRFHLGRIAAGSLGYVNSDLNLLVEMASGAIGEVLIEDTDVDLTSGAAPRLKVKASVGSLESVQWIAFLGRTLQGTGILDGRNLRARYLDDGEKRLLVTDIESLSLSGGDLTYGSNRIRGSFKNLSGGADLDSSGTLVLRDIAVEQVHLGPSYFKTPGLQTYIDKGADIRGLRIDARVEFDQTSNGARLKRIQVLQLRFGEAVLEGLRIRLSGQKADPSRHIEEVEPMAVDLARADAHDFFLRGDNLLERRFAVDIQRDYSVRALRVRMGEVGKESLKLGMSVTGSAIGGHLYGPNLTTIDLGTITMINAGLVAKGLDTGISSSRDFKLKGGLTFRKDSISIQDIDSEGTLTSWKTSYKGADGTSLDLAFASLSKTQLQDLTFHFGTVTENGKEVRRLVRISADQLRFGNVSCSKFRYAGKTVTPGTAPKTVETTVEAEGAYLSKVRIRELDLDLIKPFQRFDVARIDFGSVRGIKATLAKTLGTEKYLTEILGTITGKGIEADLTFSPTKVGDKNWTNIQGTFRLDSLGLHQPGFSYTAPDSRIRLRSTDEEDSGVQLKGLHGEFSENGTLLVGADEITEKNLVFSINGTSVSLPTVKVTSALAGLSGVGLEDGLNILGATAKELSAEHVSVTFSVDRTPSSAPDTDADKKPGPSIIAEPLGGLEGTVFYEYRALPSWLVLGNLDIKQGGIEIADVPTPVVKWSSAPGYEFSEDDTWLQKGVSYFGTGLGAVVVNLLQAKAQELNHIAGTSLTRLDLRKLVENINKPDPKAKSSSPDPKKSETAKDLSDLYKLKLDIYRLVLGEGLIGTEEKNVRLARRIAESNVLSVHSPTAVGTELNVEASEIFANQGYFELRKTLDKPDPYATPGSRLRDRSRNALRTDNIQLVNVKVTITNLATAVFTATLEVKDSKIQNIRFGDVGVLAPSPIKALPTPGSP